MDRWAEVRLFSNKNDEDNKEENGGLYGGDKQNHPDKEVILNELPAELFTPKAMQMWKLLQEAGWVDKNYQVKKSRAEAAVIAREMCLRLFGEDEIQISGTRWKPFVKLWHNKNMKADYQRAMKQDKTDDLTDKIKKLFANIK